MLLGAQLVVVDAAAGQELGARFQRHRRHEKAVGHGVVQFVEGGGRARLPIEQAIGVAVHFVARRGRQAQQQAVEVVEDGPELLVDGAVGFVDDNQVEVAGGRPSRPPAWRSIWFMML